VEYCVANEYKWQFRVASYDTGPDLRLKLSAQLRLQQEAGERHLAGAGLHYQALCDEGIVFVLTRLNSVIYRAPVFGENVTLTTWHRENKGVQFFRCYRFCDEAGNVLIDGVSAFAVVDHKTHALLRPSAFSRLCNAEQPGRTSECPDPARIKFPEEMTDAGTHTVRWSDLDCNNHLSNTVYPDIGCDVLPGGMSGRRITGFALVYQKEALEGDVLSLQSFGDSETAWISGKLGMGTPDERACFEMKVKYGR